MEQTYRLIVDQTVEAVQVTHDSIDWIADWCKGKTARETDPITRTERVVGVNVVTQHGVKLAGWGFFVAKKLNGEFKVHDAPYFFGTYALMAACWACSMQRCDQAMVVRGCRCCNRKHKS